MDCMVRLTCASHTCPNRPVSSSACCLNNDSSYYFEFLDNRYGLEEKIYNTQEFSRAMELLAENSLEKLTNDLNIQ